MLAAAAGAGPPAIPGRTVIQDQADVVGVVGVAAAGAATAAQARRTTGWEAGAARASARPARHAAATPGAARTRPSWTRPRPPRWRLA